MEAAALRYVPVMESSASASLSRSFERHLRAKNLSDGTVASYLVGVRQFTAFLQPDGRWADRGHPRRPRGVHRQPAQPLVAGTASTRYKQLQALYRWLEDEEEIAVNPMARMKPPVVPDRPIPVVPEEALRRLLAACAATPSSPWMRRGSRRRSTPHLTKKPPRWRAMRRVGPRSDARLRVAQFLANLWQGSPVWPPESRGAAAGYPRAVSTGGRRQFRRRACCRQGTRTSFPRTCPDWLMR
jgi:hypothetical protein